MNKRILIPIFAMLLALSACQQSLPVAPSPTPTSGIEVYVTEGPTCPGPVPVGSTECQDQPYQATIEVLRSDTKNLTQFQTDANGYFKLTLPAGTYILHPLSGETFPRAADHTIVVTANHYTQVSILYDTGLR
jgi:hypothetical protein